MKKILCLITIVFMCLFTTSCDINEKQTNPPEENINQPQESLYLDYVQFQVKNIETIKIKKETVNIVEVQIIENFNNMLNEVTPYSKHIDDVMLQNQTIKLIVSDTFKKYINLDDMFIYKLYTRTSININGNSENVFSTLDNEYMLIPINDEVIQINCDRVESVDNNPDYEMQSIVLRRFIYYKTDISMHFIEYDMSISYGDYTDYLFMDKISIEHFKLVLKGLSNENKDFFYKLKYSSLKILGRDYEEIMKIVKDYLLEIGG